MGIQSSINSLLSQAQRLHRYHQGIKQIENISKAQIEENEWMERAKKILSTPATEEEKAQKSISSPAGLSDYIYRQKTQMFRNMAKAEVNDRVNIINQSKSGFNAHVANLIKEYGKGSERS